jgi:uncharacterized membrane protein YebE (DUF533 family)
MLKIVLVSAATLVAATSIAQADYIDRRQSNQAYRIEQGVRSGQLSRHETARLKAEQERIAAMERAAKRDGYVSPYERARINDAQNHASRHIYLDKHDGERRWRRWHRWSWGGWGGWRRWGGWYN